MEHSPDIVPQQQPADDVLDVLAEFESGLESLKALYSQRQRLQTRIRQHEDELKAREAALAQQAAELQRVAAEHQEHQKTIQDATARIQAREAELQAAAEELAREREKLEASRGKLDEETVARAQSLEAQARKLAEESQAVETLTAELEGQASSLAQAREQLERDRESRASSLEEVENLRSEVLAQREKLTAREQEGRVLQARIEELGRELTAAGAMAEQQAQSAREAAQKAAAVGDRAQVQENALRKELEEQASRLAALERLQERASELERALLGERAESARLNAAIAEQQQVRSGLEQAVEALKSKLKMELEEREDMRVKLEAAQAGLMQATARSNQLETLLAKAMNEVKRLQEEHAAKPVIATRTASDSSMLRRRARLKLAHQMIRERSRKLAKAGEAIKRRVEQCEQVMGQRQELAAIRDRVILAERASLRKQAGGRAMVMVLCALCVFAVLAGLAWAASRELAPATYMASAEIKADGRGRVLNPAELSEWTQFHTGLLGDPRFHETAAERFKKQGLAALSSPGSVAELIRDDLTTETINSGQLALRLKGRGSNRTQLMLETFTAALASHANAARQQRLDGGVTMVSQAAAAGLDPLDNTRTIYAGALLCGGVVLSGLLWMFLWKRLVGAKTAFESDIEVANALDNARWGDFAASGAAQQVAGSRRRAGLEQE